MTRSPVHQITLRQKLTSRIQFEGPITFRDFMDAALYDPEYGYYNTERLKIGPTGDYYTSSNVHAVFGAILADSFLDLWPMRPLALVEIGAGSGQLALDILTALRTEHPCIFPETSYCIIETSPAMRARQQEKLSSFGKQVSWTQIQDLERIEGIIFSNEVVDAMPVHRIRVSDSGIRELFVATAESIGPDFDPVEPRVAGGTDSDPELLLAWGQPSSHRLEDYVRSIKIRLAEGQIIEMNLDALDWLTEMDRVLANGLLITIDYGDIAPHLYGPDRRAGTFRCFYNHRLVDDPLERIGEQDMTASVNFTVLMEHGAKLGLETLSYERQSAFLMRNGLIERMEAMQDPIGSMDEIKDRLALKNLFVPGGVSDNFRVLVQRVS
jgi:SAM-dependent MidA family methyltransferase